MKRSIVRTMLTTSIALLLTGFQITPLKISQLFKRMDETWLQVTDYCADVEIETRLLNEDSQERYLGRLWLKPPQQLMLFEYRMAEEALPVPGSSGTGLDTQTPRRRPWGALLARDKQLSRYNGLDGTVIQGIGPDDEFALLLGLLAGMGSLDKDEFLKRHDVDPVRKEDLGSLPCWTFSAHLKKEYQQVSEGPSVRTLPINWRQSLWIDAETYLPQQARIVVPGEREITVRLSGIMTNPDMAPIVEETFSLPQAGVLIDP